MTVLDHLAARPGATALEVATATGIGVDAAHQRLRALVAYGRVEGRGMYPRRYRLAGAAVPEHCDECGAFGTGACDHTHGADETLDGARL